VKGKARVYMTFQCIALDVKLGKDVRIYDFVNLYGCETEGGSRRRGMIND
jgi:hypothetical protein